MHITQIKKRNGTVVLFSAHKITLAISKAMESIGELDLAQAELLTEQVVDKVAKIKKNIISVEDIQDIVEEVLMYNNKPKLAKTYILYRHSRAQLRQAKQALIGVVEDDIDFSLNALQILEQRYLRRDSNYALCEKPSELIRRVCSFVADNQEQMQVFYQLLAKKLFFPCSPVLMYAGTKQTQLLPAYAIPVQDNMAHIFDAVRYGALAQQQGAGTGYAFSQLRPKHDEVKQRYGIAVGPIALMKMFEIATSITLQGGRRQGANMAVLRVDHPDILEFITLKQTGKSFSNFNCSVGVTDAFMRAIKTGKNYHLINPRTGQASASIPARLVFNTIIASAWNNGEPGILFIDRINKRHTCQHLGKIETTSPCAEMPLLPFEGVSEGAINVAQMVDDDGIFNWDRLKKTVEQAIIFLDNVHSKTTFPTASFEQATRATRKLGLGIMGFADLLYMLKVPYESDEGYVWASKIIKTIREQALKTSESLALQLGDFPAWKASKWETLQQRMRNATLTAISPTGTISLLCDTSQGIEPNFALVYSRKALDGRELLYVNPLFEKALKEEGLYSEHIIRQAMKARSIQDMKELPKKLRKIFVVSQDISAQGHILMQAAFQEHVDGGISKTINFDASATVKDVEEGFLLAWEKGCKGITVYRDGSMDNQIIALAQRFDKKRK